MDIILGLFTIAGFIIAIIVLFFTEQGKEVRDNIQYYSRRFITRITKHLPRDSYKLKKAQLTSSKRQSRFIRDVTVMDGSKVKISQKFRKIWEIENIGYIPWENRFLERVGPYQGAGRLKSRKRVRIPYTLPGHKCQIKVNLIAPDQPGSCYAEWKMVDEKGNILLPNQEPLFVSVDVIE